MLEDQISILESKDSQSSKFFQDQFEMDAPLFSLQDDIWQAFQSPLLSPVGSPLKSPQFSPFISHVDQQINMNFNENTYNFCLNDLKGSPAMKVQNQVNLIQNQNGYVHITQQINQVSIYQVISNESSPKISIDSNELHKSEKENLTEKVENVSNETQNSKIKRIPKLEIKNTIQHFDQVNVSPEIDSNNNLSVNDKNSDPQVRKKNEKRNTFSTEAKNAMNAWLIAHWANPYPTIKEKKMFSCMFGLTEKQVTIYFINNRSRLLNRKGWGSKNCFLTHFIK